MGFRDFLGDSVRSGLRDTIWTAIAKRLTGDVPPFWGQTAIGQSLWSDWDYEKAVRKYFRKNELIAVCESGRTQNPQSPFKRKDFSLMGHSQICLQRMVL